MISELGRINELFRYPVKSMAGTSVGSAMLGWHGLDGDRRLAFRRLSDTSGFPWLSASRLPAMLLYQPEVVDASAGAALPSYVRTPDGVRLELNGDALREELSLRFGSGVELMKLNQGVFDEASVSVISVATMLGVERELKRPVDRRRFRPNVVVETHDGEAFSEDHWVGRRLVFGDSVDGASVSITLRDQRCMMLNLDPDTAKQDPAVMKAVVRMNQNNAGVYGTVVREGPLTVGQRVFLVSESAR
jgi:uncharacterized protein YcbX